MSGSSRAVRQVAWRRGAGGTASWAARPTRPPSRRAVVALVPLSGGANSLCTGPRRAPPPGGVRRRERQDGAGGRGASSL